MIGVVLCTHSNLGAALLETANMIVGEYEQATSVSVLPEESGEDIVDKLLQAIREVDAGSGVLILCDMFGGTPSNVSLTQLSDNVEVVTGANLPMLLKLYTSREGPLDEVARQIQSHGRENILVAGALLGTTKVQP